MTGNHFLDLFDVLLVATIGIEWDLCFSPWGQAIDNHLGIIDADCLDFLM